MKKTRRPKRLLRKDRGSALLVSLMVIVGLSLLGLGFVTVSETETAIAKNQQTALQTQAIAEAGARLVVEWFQDPSWGLKVGGMPANDSTNANLAKIKIKRVLPDSSNPYSGYYKDDPSKLLFDKPYRPGSDDRLYGTEDSADIIINRTTDVATIDGVNNILLGSADVDKRDGEITEIRVFAPPITGATQVNINNPDGTVSHFWKGGNRYGVATIKVTASVFRDPKLTESTTPKKSDASNILATHSVRLVVGEIPVPIPGGPIQSNTAISFGGDYRVHWGNETAAYDPTIVGSTGNLKNTRNPASLPWANAYERTHFEHGFEPGSSIATVAVVQGGSNYSNSTTASIGLPCTWNTSTNTCQPCVAGCSTATVTVTIDTANGNAIKALTLQSRGSGYTAYPPTINGVSTSQNWGPLVTITDPTGKGSGALAYAAVGAEAWPLPMTTFDSGDYFHEIIGKTYEDLWFGSRAGGTNTLCQGNSFPQCFTYDLTSVTNDETAGSNAGGPVPGVTYAFQSQKQNVYPWLKTVTFPKIVYDFWKKTTQQGRGYKGLYYFSYDDPAKGGTGGFKKFGVGTAKPMSYWVNELPMSGGKGGSGLGPGIYFFDTIHGVSPQPNNTSELTPTQSWSAADLNQNFLMSGFVYMNTQNWDTSGAGSAPTSIYGNFPGEPFRDIGYPVYDVANKKWATQELVNGVLTDCEGICRNGVGNGQWDCQKDMSATGNRCDIVTMPAPAWWSYDPAIAPNAAGTIYIPKVWKAPLQAVADYGKECTVPLIGFDGTNARDSDCSTPMEPYLNVIYTDTDCKDGSKCLVVAWEKSTGSNVSDQTRKPKVLDSATQKPVSCSSGGGVPKPSDCTSNAYDIDGALVPLTVLLNGVLYNEGGYTSAGNDTYFGSLLIKGAVGGTGTPDIWFDEKLIKGSWAPPGMPRVMVFNEQTDEQQQ